MRLHPMKTMELSIKYILDATVEFSVGLQWKCAEVKCVEEISQRSFQSEWRDKSSSKTDVWSKNKIGKINVKRKQ